MTAVKTKQCRGCKQELDIAEFYKHPQTSDGRLNHCKRCVRARVRKHRRDNVEQAREYDRNRPNRKERFEKQHRRKVWRKKSDPLFPKKYKAQTEVGNAVRNGRLVKPDKCELCSEHGLKLHGHHEDYDKPLEVVWLCVPCHVAVHHGKAQLK